MNSYAITNLVGGRRCTPRSASIFGATVILVPDTVRDLLSGKQFLFSDRGEFVPKGFDDAVRRYEVRWRD